MMTPTVPSVLFLMLAYGGGLAFAQEAKNPAVCEENLSIAFFVTDNTILKSEDSIVYKDTSEEECLQTCSLNRDKFDRVILCASFVYDHSAFTCTVYKTKAGPVGNASIESSIGKRYFEKMCLPRGVPQECAGSQFIRVDDSVLVGYASSLTLVETIDQCVAQCIKEQDCKSAMFFYEDGECITNRESALTQPNSFAKEETDKVIYFQNGCIEAKRSAQKSVQDISKEVEETTTPTTSTTTALEGSGIEHAGETTEDEEVEEETPVEVVTQISETTPALVEEELKDVSAEHQPDQETEYEEYEEEEETTPSTTTTTTTTTTAPLLKKKIIKGVEKKYKKHPKNFASKTFKINKKKIVEPIEEPVERIEVSEEPIESETLPYKKKVEAAPEKEGNYFSDWSDWTPCTKSGERQVRRRRCLDLRKCLGALMQVQNCPAVLTSPAPATIESIRSVVGVNGEEFESEVPFQPLTHQQPQLVSDVWGSWQGVCQHFASSQPCNNGNMIGFESRECLAKDAGLCDGPFFRYCTLSC